MIEVWGVQNLFTAERLEAFGDQPVVEPLDQTVAQKRRFHHAAVEENVRRACESALATPDRCGVRTIGGLLREEAGQVFCDRGIGRVRQSEFLKSDAALPHGHFGIRHDREEAIDQRLFDVFAQQLGLDSSADQLRAFAEHGDRMFLGPRLREELFFRYPRLMPERLQLPGVYAMAVVFQPLL